MAAPLHRIEILLREDQHRTLARRAEQEKTSVSDLVRRLVDDELRLQSSAQHECVLRRKEALASIRKHHDEILASRDGRPIEINPSNLVRQLREERDDDLFGHQVTGPV